jgi:translation initiation factor IF-3
MNEDKKINYNIYHKQITLVDADGNFKGVVDRNYGIEQAKEFGLDLVQFSSDEEQFPICKIIDFGKYKYQQSKKERKNLNNVIVVKEIRIGYNISDHDLETKHNIINKFLEKKYKVKYTLKLKGCPYIHYDLAKSKFREKISVFVEKADFGTEEFGDKTMSIMLTPKNK